MKNIDNLIDEVYYFSDYYTYDDYDKEQLLIIMSNQRDHINYLENEVNEYKKFIILLLVVGLIGLLAINFIG